MTTAKIFGISRHRLTTDGEGVTTLVAFNGCPLRWWHSMAALCAASIALTRLVGMLRKVAITRLKFFLRR